jgi:hypothetical protein
MQDVLAWGGVLLAAPVLLWLMSRLAVSATAGERQRRMEDGLLLAGSVSPTKRESVRLLHVVVLEELAEPLVTGFFNSEKEARLHAYRLVTGEDFRPGKGQSIEDWQADGVHVTRFVAAHAPA